MARTLSGRSKEGPLGAGNFSQAAGGGFHQFVQNHVVLSAGIHRGADFGQFQQPLITVRVPRQLMSGRTPSD